VRASSSNADSKEHLEWQIIKLVTALAHPKWLNCFALDKYNSKRATLDGVACSKSCSVANVIYGRSVPTGAAEQNALAGCIPTSEGRRGCFAIRRHKGFMCDNLSCCSPTFNESEREERKRERDDTL